MGGKGIGICARGRVVVMYVCKRGEGEVARLAPVGACTSWAAVALVSA